MWRTFWSRSWRQTVVSSRILPLPSFWCFRSHFPNHLYQLCDCRLSCLLSASPGTLPDVLCQSRHSTPLCFEKALPQSWWTRLHPQTDLNACNQSCSMKQIAIFVWRRFSQITCSCIDLLCSDPALRISCFSCWLRSRTRSPASERTTKMHCCLSKHGSGVWKRLNFWNTRSIFWENERVTPFVKQQRKTLLGQKIPKVQNCKLCKCRKSKQACCRWRE